MPNQSSEHIKLTIEPDDDGARIDVYLCEALDGISRSRLQRWIKDGLISSDKKGTIKKNHILTSGETLQVNIPTPQQTEVLAEDIAIDIVYQDRDVAVINKPVGMVVHPAPGNYSGTLVNAIMHHIDDLSDIGGVIRPGIVHRIDKDTSGLLMIAKNNQAHGDLSTQLKAHTVIRKYIALVRGGFNHDEGTIDKPIGRHSQNRLKMAINERQGRRAVTHYRVLERLGDFTLIECILETGRTHQIRVHLASIAHPLVGDPLYGIKKDRQNGNGQLLHATLLGFKHPCTGELMQFEAEMPIKMQHKLDKLRRLHAT